MTIKTSCLAKTLTSISQCAFIFSIMYCSIDFLVFSELTSQGKMLQVWRYVLNVLFEGAYRSLLQKVKVRHGCNVKSSKNLLIHNLMHIHVHREEESLEKVNVFAVEEHDSSSVRQEEPVEKKDVLPQNEYNSGSSKCSSILVEEDNKVSYYV